MKKIKIIILSLDMIFSLVSLALPPKPDVNYKELHQESSNKMQDSYSNMFESLSPSVFSNYCLKEKKSCACWVLFKNIKQALRDKKPINTDLLREDTNRVAEKIVGSVSDEQKNKFMHDIKNTYP